VGPDSGAYPVQPAAAAPPVVRKPDITIRPPNRNSQNDRALSRGNAMSAAPIWRGVIAFAKPMASGPAKNSSIRVPWTVNSWSYVEALTSCWPGCASSSRMISAIAPPISANPKAEVMYRIPIRL